MFFTITWGQRCLLWWCHFRPEIASYSILSKVVPSKLKPAERAKSLEQTASPSAVVFSKMVHVSQHRAQADITGGIFQSRWHPFFSFWFWWQVALWCQFPGAELELPQQVFLVKAPINRTRKRPLLSRGRGWSLVSILDLRPSLRATLEKDEEVERELYCLLDGILRSRFCHSPLPHWNTGVIWSRIEHPRGLLPGFYSTDLKHLSHFLLSHKNSNLSNRDILLPTGKELLAGRAGAPSVHCLHPVVWWFSFLK